MRTDPIAIGIKTPARARAVVAVMALTVALPYLPIARTFEFVPLPPLLLGLLAAITALYVFAAEVAKRRVFGRLGLG